jgi:Icc-related predicted phosphoesterase
MVRVAAVGDLHVVAASAGRLRRHYADVAEHADLLLLAGDITDRGLPAEAAVAAAELRDLGLPTVAVLGNHDHAAGAAATVAATLAAAGIDVVDGDARTVRAGGVAVTVGGTKGFAGGFGRAAVSGFGEQAMHAFAAEAEREAGRLRAALAGPVAGLRIALVHYAPVAATLEGELVELYPWLGSSLLADAIDAAGGIDLAVHGHAHYGSETGVTAGGVSVRNVARPVIKLPYAVYQLPGGATPP